MHRKDKKKHRKLFVFFTRFILTVMAEIKLERKVTNRATICPNTEWHKKELFSKTLVNIKYYLRTFEFKSCGNTYNKHKL